MSIKHTSINFIVLTVSMVIALFASEVGARMILHPADYLNVEIVPDDVLGFVPSPYTLSSGYDAWGFRNTRVPQTADIVAIGDSHTYGNTARMDDAWPAVVSRVTGLGVYNMGLGGYGPNQYLELLKRRGVGLKPRLVVLGFYMGDDFENAFVITYGLEHWNYLRQLPPERVAFDRSEILEPQPAVGLQKQARIWLSRHSVVYQLALHGPLFGHFQGEVQIANASRLYESATSISIPEKHILEAFRPAGILKNLNQNSESVREGMRIAFALLREMDDVCRQNGIQLLVAVIPTKESVFSDYLEHNQSLPSHDIVDKLLANERIAREKLFQFFTDASIPYVDALPALKKSVEHELYARTAADMHPGRNGYRVIGEAVSQRVGQMLGRRLNERLAEN